MGNAEDFTKEFMKDMFGGGGVGGGQQPVQQQPTQQSYNSPQGLYSEDAIKREAARG